MKNSKKLIPNDCIVMNVGDYHTTFGQNTSENSVYLKVGVRFVENRTPEEHTCVQNVVSGVMVGSNRLEDSKV